MFKTCFGATGAEGSEGLGIALPPMPTLVFLGSAGGVSLLVVDAGEPPMNWIDEGTLGAT